MDDETLSRREAVLLQWACAGAVLLRLILIFRYRFDSDEPQHMHVAWAWTRGLLQYRDVFDNHMPLFHVLSAPLFRVMGENVDVLYLARLCVLPLYLGTLVLVFSIGERLFDRRTALWATALTACFPPFFLGSLEYRADDLWIVFWFACVALLVSSARPMRKMVMAGLALGFAFAVSMKSILFVLAIVTAVVATNRLTRGVFPVTSGAIVRRVATFGGCALLVPSLIAAYFASVGAWRQFAYCVLWHNGSTPNDQWWKVFWLVPGVPAIRFAAYRYAAAEGEPALVRRRLFIFLVASTYLLYVAAFWPVIAPETYLPLYPLAILLVTPSIVRRDLPWPGWRARSREGNSGRPAGALRLAPFAVAVALVATTVMARVWRDDAEAQVSLIRQVLQITQPNDAVMDLKGESVFRRRPYWLVLESITHRKLRHGVLRDDIAAALIRSGTAVLASDAFPPATSRFVHHNYVPWGRLWVLGRRIRARGVSTVPIPFRIVVPSTYVVVGGSKCVPAAIDGHRVDRGIALNPGWHTLRLDDPVASPLVIWSGVTRGTGFSQRLAELRIRMRQPRDIAMAAGE